ncbi:zinc finger protein-like 1 homolog [Gigantopelta aegis]|uniref:zinc finger protein-like 1 homolog n=1 Tax=Gigantopelta aegis TaxID=1735272 RepID=UPI001B88E4B0|nr:zinc finger protein-like 1 homolog [Gigantopelta aegis]
MGLCKCPKRKVTNLFCFEHRVNVCENCLVTNHQQCIVQSYLHWLQDSDYSPLCTLCNQQLSDEDAGPCVRLVCYDLFHWNCLDRYAQQMPAHTAPAGYTCPTCKVGIFPPPNLISPVADVLRNLLSKVNWARAGLGLPLIEEPNIPVPSEKALKDTPQEKVVPLRAEAALNASPAVGAPPSVSVPPAPLASPPNYTRPSAQVPPYTSTPTVAHGNHGSAHSVIGVDTGATSRVQDRTTGYGVDPRKLFDSTKGDDIFNMSHDHDEDKYKRRSAFNWLAKWFKSIDKKRKKDPNAVRKRFLMVLLLGIIGFITFVVILSKLGRDSAENDPFLDPLANPNIRNQEANQPAG